MPALKIAIKTENHGIVGQTNLHFLTPDISACDVAAKKKKFSLGLPVQISKFN